MGGWHGGDVFYFAHKCRIPLSPKRTTRWATKGGNTYNLQTSLHVMPRTIEQHGTASHTGGDAGGMCPVFGSWRAPYVAYLSHQREFSPVAWVDGTVGTFSNLQTVTLYMDVRRQPWP